MDCVNYVFQSIAAGNTQAVRQYLSSGNISCYLHGLTYTQGRIQELYRRGGGACNFFCFQGRPHLGAPETTLKSC